MYIKNRRDSDKFKAFGSCQAWCLTKSKVLKIAYISYTKRYMQAIKTI